MKKNKSLNELANNTRNRFVVIAIDETKYWSDEIQAIAGKIESVYLVNLKEPTNLCELAVSYPAKFLYNFFHEETDDSFGWEMFTGEDTYFKGSNRYYPRKIYTEGTEDEIFDHESGNPTVC